MIDLFCKQSRYQSRNHESRSRTPESRSQSRAVLQYISGSCRTDTTSYYYIHVLACSLSAAAMSIHVTINTVCLVLAVSTTATVHQYSRRQMFHNNKTTTTNKYESSGCCQCPSEQSCPQPRRQPRRSTAQLPQWSAAPPRPGQTRSACSHCPVLYTFQTTQLHTITIFTNKIQGKTTYTKTCIYWKQIF